MPIYLPDAEKQKFFERNLIKISFFNLKSGSCAFRYGFNGKENDNEISASGNQYDLWAKNL
jgi:hypothetical protein